MTCTYIRPSCKHHRRHDRGGPLDTVTAEVVADMDAGVVDPAIGNVKA